MLAWLRIVFVIVLLAAVMPRVLQGQDEQSDKAAVSLSEQNVETVESQQTGSLSEGWQSDPLTWELAPTGTRASLRGLAVVGDKVIWACGSASTVVVSKDGGASWNDASPAFDDLEFRSIHAWDDRRACIASAGSPAILLRTEDAGETWTEVYREPSSSAFFDGLQFWDEQRGICFSDPVDGNLLILETRDSGLHWKPIDKSVLKPTLEGEAGFAASNSSLATGPEGRVWIGTGGISSSTSRVHYRNHFAANWEISECPIPSGQAEGIFSIAISAHKDQQPKSQEGPALMVAVGGDYRADATSRATAAISRDGGVSWNLPKSPPPAFRSCVISLKGGGWLSVGPTGCDFSPDAEHWTTFDSTGFHVVQQGNEDVFAVGSDGRFAVLKGLPRSSPLSR